MTSSLVGLPPPVTQLQNWPIMKWVQRGPDTRQTPSILEKVCHNLLLYPITVSIHTIIPYYPVLWPHLPLLEIFSCLFSSSTFPPRLCPPSLPTLYFWAVVCLHLSDGLVFDIGLLTSYSAPLCYSLCLFISGIVTGNETGSTSGAFCDSWDLSGTSIFSLNYSPRSPLTKTLFSVII